MPGVKEVTLQITSGSFVSLVGSSGSGKTTCLRLIAGLETPTAGKLVVPDRVAMVFQNAALFPWATVLENAAFGLQMLGEDTAQATKKAMMQLEVLGLADSAKLYPRQLSGGQRQRVGIARALAVDPPVLLLDEPFSALDEDVREELRNDILRIWQERRLTIVMISHQIDEAVAMSQKIVVMKDYAIASIHEVDVPYPRPAHAHDVASAVERIRASYHSANMSL
jgi:NitT/TauT family transport system ATP-binding protein